MDGDTELEETNGVEEIGETEERVHGDQWTKLKGMYIVE